MSGGGGDDPLMGQLPLPLAYRPASGQADFIHAPANADAALWLDAPPAARTLLVGPPASGKTHLGRLFADSHGATLIDDADRAPQEALFHAWNAASVAAPILLTACTLPRQWVTLPDLASRLAATPTLIIGPPDEALLAKLLVKQFADRGIRIAAEVAAFVLLRTERSFDAIATTVAALDATALAQGREVTIPLARAVLDGQGDLLSTHK